MYQLPQPMPFSVEEYKDRVKRVRTRMAEQGMDVLLITSPAHIYYLTGHDAESFFTEQVLVVDVNDEMPTYIGRPMDTFPGIELATWLKPGHIFAYPDYYVQSDERHPMDWISRKLIDLGFGNKTIGVEMDAYYLSANAWEHYKANLPNAKLVNGSNIVKWVRLIKSDAEIKYMMQAGKVSEVMIKAFYENAKAGVRTCDLAAEVQRAAYAGTPEVGGEWCACTLNFPRGKLGGVPHVHWDDQPLPDDITIFLEAAGVSRRYHAPFSRTVCIGKAPDKFIEKTKIFIEGLETALSTAKAGVTCAEVAERFAGVLAKYGMEKEARIGYSCGIGFFPCWGEATISLRPGDNTILQPNMTLHCIPGYYSDDYGFSISQSFRITETGIEKFYDVPFDVKMN